MSLAVGAPSSLEENKDISDKNGNLDGKNGDAPSEGEEPRIGRTASEASLCATEEEEEDDEGKAAKMIDLGPQVSIRHHMEKDKDDESLRRWKEQLLGSVDMNSVGETLEPDVKILSLSIISPGRADIVLPVTGGANPKGVWFTLKEDSHYKLKFFFSVSNNIVSGLRYTNTVWKTGVKVDSAKAMLGTFSPQSDPYVYETPEDTTPSGLFARGSYSAKTRFVDDDGKCYLEINYTFDIRKDWASAAS